MRVHTLYFKEQRQAEAAKRVVPSGEVGTLHGSPVLQFVTQDPIKQTDRSRIDFCACPTRSVFNVILY